MPYHINKKAEGSFVVEFKPTNVGEYIIQIFLDRVAISGSPFKCLTFDPNRVNVFHPRDDISVYQEVQYESKPKPL